MTPEQKHQAIRQLLRPEMICAETDLCYNCLPPELRDKYDIVGTPNVSAHEYDPYANEIVRGAPGGWVLDCGAGSRSDFRANVVNCEIVAYPSTNVLGVAEELPFRDDVFDGVLCLNVLEHVKDPFRAAREISRVLKPGGRLYCVVPFLQPRHGYPHHYYNMTAQGVKNLFANTLHIERQMLLASGLPIWNLREILQMWLAGLEGRARDDFLAMRVSDLIGDPLSYLTQPFVTELSQDKNFELATTTALLATKP